MMNKYKSNYILVALLGMLSLTGCLSDGSLGGHDSEKILPSESSTKIISFKVRPASAQKSEAKSKIEIDQGDSVIISWEVLGAKSVSIQNDTFVDTFKSKVLGLSGEQQVDHITKDETFQLIAQGGLDGEEAKGSVTVTVRQSAPATITSFSATPDTIRSGATSDLCFQLSDKSAKAKITAGDNVVWSSDTAEATDDGSDGTEITDDTVIQDPYSLDSLSTQKSLFFAKVATPAAPQDPYAGSGGEETTEDDTSDEPTCVTVSPTETTKYVLTVVNADGSDGDSKDATVTVTASELSIVFTAQPTQLSSEGGDVVLNWTVTPADAQVNIEPAGASNEASSGARTVKVSTTTTFTLTATTKDGQSKTVEATVVVGGGTGGINLRLTASSQSVFAGESVDLAVTGDAVPSSVTLLDPAGNATETNVADGKITIAKPVSGSYTVESNGSRSNSVSLEVRALKQRSTKGVYGVASSDTQRIIAGSDTGDVATESVAGKNVDVLNMQFSQLSGDAMLDVKFDAAAPLSDRINKDIKKTKLSFFAPYTIRVVLVDASNPNRLYAGATGALLISEDSGTSWNLVDPLMIFDNAHNFTSRDEEHKGCDGSTQKGIKYSKANGAWVGMIQICDIVADGKSVVLATDQGTYHINNIDARLDAATRKANPWKQGIVGKVVNALASIKTGDQTILIAAASDGVYVNDQAGDPKAWQQLDKENLSGAVNAIAVSGGTLFAGTDGGLFKHEGLDASGKWEAVATPAPADGAMSIKALAVDAANKSTLYVGTQEGLFVARSCGKSFTVVPADLGDVRNIAVASDGSQSTVAVATSKGLFTSTGLAVSGDACSAVPAPTPKPATTPDPANTPTTDKPTVTVTTPTAQPINAGPGTVTPQ